MSDIKDRLKETSDNCLKAYEVWSADKKNVANREILQDSIHELRKVSSRLEIELAIAERDQMAQRPIPIPPHRDAKKRPAESDADNIGNTGGDDDGGYPQHQRNKPQQQQRRRIQRRPTGNEG